MSEQRLDICPVCGEAFREMGEKYHIPCWDSLCNAEIAADIAAGNLEDLRERIDALEDVIRELTEADKYGVPGGYRDRGFDWPYRDWCTYCLRSWAREEQEQHDDDCPILRARALLERIARNDGDESEGGGW